MTLTFEFDNTSAFQYESIIDTELIPEIPKVHQMGRAFGSAVWPTERYDIVQWTHRLLHTATELESASGRFHEPERSITSSADQRRYVTLTTSVLSARGPFDVCSHIVLNFCSACGVSVEAQSIVGAGRPAKYVIFVGLACKCP